MFTTQSLQPKNAPYPKSKRKNRSTEEPTSLSSQQMTIFDIILGIGERE